MTANPDVSLSALEAEVEQALMESRKPQYPVQFLCMTQKIDKTSKFSIVVECCHVRRVNFRRKFWTRKGYREWQLSDVKKIYLKSNTAFKIVFYENVKIKNEHQAFQLHFHKRRENVLFFETDLKTKTSQCINALVEVHTETDVVGHSSNLANFDITLTHDVMERDLTKVSFRRPSKNRTTLESEPTTFHGLKPPKQPQQLSAFEKLQASLASALKNIDPIDLDKVNSEIQTVENKSEKKETVYFNVKTLPHSGKCFFIAFVFIIILFLF